MTPLRVLILEDRPDDAVLMMQELRRSGFDPNWRRVESREAYLAELDPGIEIILSDYQLPQYDALKALTDLQERQLDIPFIVVTGAVSEEIAVQCMKQGADDYLLKDRLARLGPAVSHALEQRRLGREKRRAEEIRQRTEQQFRDLLEAAPDAMVIVDETGRIVFVNLQTEKLFGYSREELLGQPVETVVPDRFRDKHEEHRASYFADPRRRPMGAGLALFARRKNGSEFPVEVSLSPLIKEKGFLVSAAIRDVTERKRSEEAMHQLAAIVENSNDAIISLSLDGRIVTWNPGAERLYGYSAQEALTQTVAILVPSEATNSVLSILRRLNQGDRMTRYETRHGRKDGSVIDVMLSFSAIRDADGNATSISVIAQDITERKRAEKEMQRARQAAEEANQAKSAFLANVSHEIRTPLNGIIGMTELALDTPLSPEQRDYLNMVRSSAESLLKVVNDVLDFSKIEARKLGLEHVAFGLRDSVGDAMKALGLQALRRSLELTCHILPDVPDSLVGDPARFRQILVNLVGNAIKFTKKGEIVVRVEVDQRRETDVMLHVTVTDTGIGIPDSKLKAIFEPFEQADGSTTRRYGGTGLGLAISTELVEMMGGRIWVESEVGHGSKFHFTAVFGLQKTAELIPGTATGAGQAFSLWGLRVLVVDDNPRNRQVLEEMLISWHMKPATADGGRTALFLMEQAQDAGEPFAITLIDSQMPGMNGYTVARHVGKNPKLAGTRLVMLTSGDSGEIARFRELGITEYLMKPVKQQELLDTITRTIRGDAPTAPQPIRHLGEGPGAGESPRLRVLLAEDNPVNQTMTVNLLRRRGHVVAVAANGKEALAALEKDAFDVVLMDVQMPEMDGLEAAKQIRDREKQTRKRVPIIALTAHTMLGDRERCLDAGMDAFVTKPIQARELFEVIERMVSPEAAPIDMDELLARMGGDNDLIREIVDLFLQECPRAMAQLREAVDAKAAEKIERAAHTMKGMVGNLAAAPALAASDRLVGIGRSRTLDHAKEAFLELDAELKRVQAALGTFVEPVPQS